MVDHGGARSLTRLSDVYSKAGKKPDWAEFGNGIGSALPPPLAGEGWGGGMNLREHADEFVPRSPHPPRFFKRGDLPRKRER